MNKKSFLLKLGVGLLINSSIIAIVVSCSNDDNKNIKDVNKNIKVLKSDQQYKTGLNLDSKIYNNVTAKFLAKENEALVPLGSNYMRVMYIASENLLIRFSLTNPHMRRAYITDKSRISKYQSKNKQTTAYLKVGFNDGDIDLNTKITNSEEIAIKKQFFQTNEQITSLKSTMKFGFAYITYVGTKYDESSTSYKAWESIDKSDYIFSNLMETTIAADKIYMIGSKSRYQTKLDKLQKLVDLPGYTGIKISKWLKYGQIKQIVLDATSTSMFTNTMKWYIDYFSKN